MPCLEGVHASVHVFMSTQLPMLAQLPVDSHIETWVFMYVTVCVCLSHPFVGPTP